MGWTSTWSVGKKIGTEDDLIQAVDYLRNTKRADMASTLKCTATTPGMKLNMSEPGKNTKAGNLQIHTNHSAPHNDQQPQPDRFKVNTLIFIRTCQGIRQQQAWLRGSQRMDL